MELNEHHHQNIVNYLKFSRYRRAAQLRAVDGNFEDHLASRVSLEETYTGDELEDILKVGNLQLFKWGTFKISLKVLALKINQLQTHPFQELNQVVRADVESEFLDSNHTNCLLLRQLFKQAEKWHLKLNIDTSGKPAPSQSYYHNFTFRMHIPDLRLNLTWNHTELENKALLDEVAKLEDSSSSQSIRNESKTKLTPIQDSGTLFFFSFSRFFLSLKQHDVHYVQ